MTRHHDRPEGAEKLPTALQQAGIEQRELRIGDVSLREVPSTSLARLRFFREPTAADCPLPELPLQTGHCGGGNPQFLCLGPREWLVMSPHGTANVLTEALRPATDNGRAVAYDLSDALAVFRLAGKAAPWLLAKLSCLDFVKGQHGGRHCARTRVVDIPVTVYYHQAAGDEWVFDLISDRSTASYLWALLRDSAPHANELKEAHGASA